MPWITDPTWADDPQWRTNLITVLSWGDMPDSVDPLLAMLPKEKDSECIRLAALMHCRDKGWHVYAFDKLRALNGPAGAIVAVLTSERMVPVALEPADNFDVDSMEIWIDEEAGKIHAVVNGDLVRIRLR